MTRRFTYPDWLEPGVTPPLLGCGTTFEQEPDDEGLVDCPSCGIWFKASERGVSE